MQIERLLSKDARAVHGGFGWSLAPPLVAIGEGDDALILGAVADLAKARMIAILLAAPGVASGGLNVAVGERADPDVGPDRRNGERLDAAQAVLVGQSRAVRPRVREARAGSSAPDAGTRIGHVTQPGRLGRPLGVDDRLRLG